MASPSFAEVHLETALLVRSLVSLQSEAESSQPQLENRLDWLVMLYASAWIFVLNWTFRKAIVEPIGKFVILKTTADQIDIRKRTDKLAQSVMEAVFYSVFFVLGLKALDNQVWIWPSKEWWKPISETWTMRNDFRAFYLLYGARYIQSFISVCMEYRRRDFVEMQVHHSATVVVIILSYIAAYCRVGGVIMVLLDVGDIPLHVAKICKYLATDSGRSVAGQTKKRVDVVNPKFQLAADICFAIFAVVYTVTRMGMYPYVVWSALVEAPQYGGRTLEHGYYACCALLLLLLGLQCFWFNLLCKVIWKVLTDGAVEDCRSDSDSDDESQACQPSPSLISATHSKRKDL